MIIPVFVFEELDTDKYLYKVEDRAEKVIDLEISEKNAKILENSDKNDRYKIIDKIRNKIYKILDKLYYKGGYKNVGYLNNNYFNSFYHYLPNLSFF